MSVGVMPMREPIEKPLLRIEWWLRHAAFGAEVVPDVNWIFTISSRCNTSSGMTVSCLFELEDWKISVNGLVERKEEVSIREAELSTKMILSNEGTEVDSNFELSRSGTRVLRSEIFSLGGL